MLAYRIAIAALLCVALSGCSLILPQFENPTVRTTETVWQGMNLVDTAQTVTIARSPECMHEADPLAVAIYGSEHPRSERVILTNALLAFTHAQIGAWLDRHTTAAALDPDDNSYAGWYLLRHAYYGLSLGGTGYSVLRNATHRVGLFTRVDGCGIVGYNRPWSAYPNPIPPRRKYYV